MKKILELGGLTLAILIMTVTIGFSNNNLPVNESSIFLLIKNSEVSFSLQNIKDEKLFVSTSFSTQDKTIFLETEKEISFIQVINESGVLEYQIPVGSKKLHLDLYDFDTGSYSINILLENSDEFITAELQKTF